MDLFGEQAGLVLPIWQPNSVFLQDFVMINLCKPRTSDSNGIFSSPWSIDSAGLSITLVFLSIKIRSDAQRDPLDPEVAA